MLGNFNVNNYGWTDGSPLPNYYYCSKIKGNSIYVVSCCLGFDQQNNSIINIASLDLVFSMLAA
jgi:hypothetical protein